jgi:hypothetical protein
MATPVFLESRQIFSLVNFVFPLYAQGSVSVYDD